jgi:Tol biopolymer transport system component
LSLAATAQATDAPGGSGRIFFARDSIPGPGSNLDIHAINPDGSGLVNLTPGLFATQFQPSVDPTGRMVVFRHGDGTDTDIWRMRSDGSAQINLTPGAGPDTTPSFSPDGRRIVFSRDIDPAAPLETDILIMNLDGTGVTNLTNTSGLDETDPDFSPDGRRIVFTVFSAGEIDLNSIAADGSDRRGVAPGPDTELTPAYSPDGKRLVFSRLPPSHLFLADAAGGGPVDITPAIPTEAFSPSWSPNSKRIVFDDDGHDLFFADVAGGPVFPLTDDSQDDFGADWEHVFKCGGRRATIVGDAGPDKIKGTKKPDVIVANAGKDVVRGRGGRDRICGGKGRDVLRGGGGVDLLKGGKGRDVERQ